MRGVRVSCDWKQCVGVGVGVGVGLVRGKGNCTWTGPPSLALVAIVASAVRVDTNNAPPGVASSMPFYNTRRDEREELKEGESGGELGGGRLVC